MAPPNTRARSQSKDPMATPRRSSRIAASRASSAVPSETSGRDESPDAGAVGRLARATPSVSRAYGGKGDRASASREPELELPTEDGNLADALAGGRVERSPRHSPARVNRRRKTTSEPVIVNDRHLPGIEEEREEVVEEEYHLVNRDEIEEREEHHHPVERHEHEEPKEPTPRPGTSGTSASRNTGSSFFDKTFATFREGGFFGHIMKNYGGADGTQDLPNTPRPPKWRVAQLCLLNVSNFLMGVGAKIFGAFFWFLLAMCIAQMWLNRVGPINYAVQRYSQFQGLLSNTTGTTVLPGHAGGHRLDSVQADLGRVRDHIQLVEDNLRRLESSIPEDIILVHNPTTGRAEIPEAFWNALTEKLGPQNVGKGAQSRSPSWDEFWNKNQARLRTYLSTEVPEHVKTALKNDVIIDKSTFTEMLQMEYRKVEDRIDQVLKEFETTLPQRYSNIQNRWYSQLPGRQADEWVIAVLLENAKLALRSYNFFSAWTGATVIPNLTSPTQTKKLNWKQKLYTSLIWIPNGHPPIAALEPWDEAGDCWCAAASHRGEAQIGIKIPQKIYPTKLIVEHIPQQATLDIETAPKWVELWIEVDDEKHRQWIIETNNNMGNEYGQKPSKYAPAKNYVFIGKWFYDINAPNHIQTFGLDVNFANLQIPVHKAVVRVTENYGREWTCLYRLRLQGELAEPLFVREE